MQESRETRTVEVREEAKKDGERMEESGSKKNEENITEEQEKGGRGRPKWTTMWNQT